MGGHQWAILFHKVESSARYGVYLEHINFKSQVKLRFSMEVAKTSIINIYTMNYNNLNTNHGYDYLYSVINRNKDLTVIIKFLEIDNLPFVMNDTIILDYDTSILFEAIRLNHSMENMDVTDTSKLIDLFVNNFQTGISYMIRNVLNIPHSNVDIYIYFIRYELIKLNQSIVKSLFS